jgi:hypothetical protein
LYVLFGPHIERRNAQFVAFKAFPSPARPAWRNLQAPCGKRTGAALAIEILFFAPVLTGAAHGGLWPKAGIARALVSKASLSIATNYPRKRLVQQAFSTANSAF